MITIRCTSTALSFINDEPLPDPPQATAALGDWYLNVVPTAGGDLLLFVNERTLLTVAVPASVRSPLNVFVARVANLLVMLETPPEIIDDEIRHYSSVKLAETAEDSVLLRSMNEIARQCQDKAEHAEPGDILSLSDMELDLADMPLSALHFRTARDYAEDLLGALRGHMLVN